MYLVIDWVERESHRKLHRDWCWSVPDFYLFSPGKLFILLSRNSRPVYHHDVTVMRLGENGTVEIPSDNEIMLFFILEYSLFESSLKWLNVIAGASDWVHKHACQSIGEGQTRPLSTQQYIRCRTNCHEGIQWTGGHILSFLVCVVYSYIWAFDLWFSFL